MNGDKRIWALLDGRAGNSTQTLGIAERLGGVVEEKHLLLNGFSRLSNVLLQDRLWGFDPASRGELETHNPPEIAIAAGRRLAPALLHLKRCHPSMHVIQLMAPGMAESEFDTIILPSHDRRKEEGNILVTLGAPNRVTPAKIAEQAAKWRLKLNLHAPVTTVLIGGATTEGEMTVADAEALWQALAPLRQGSLLVTTSRRTPPLVVAFLREVVTPPHLLFRYGDAENPYLAFLGLADRLVVTADSVSMLSEACVTGKPVYAFAEGRAMKPKHLPLLRELEDAGHLRLLQNFDPAWQGGVMLNEAGRIAAILRGRLGWPDPALLNAAPLKEPASRLAPPRATLNAKGRPRLSLVKK